MRSLEFFKKYGCVVNHNRASTQVIITVQIINEPRLSKYAMTCHGFSFSVTERTTAQKLNDPSFGRTFLKIREYHQMT